MALSNMIQLVVWASQKPKHIQLGSQYKPKFWSIDDSNSDVDGEIVASEVEISTPKLIAKALAAGFKLGCLQQAEEELASLKVSSGSSHMLIWKKKYIWHRRWFKQCECSICDFRN